MAFKTNYRFERNQRAKSKAAKKAAKEAEKAARRAARKDDGSVQEDAVGTLQDHGAYDQGPSSPDSQDS